MNKIKVIKEPEGVNIPEGKLRVILDDQTEAIIEVYVVDVPIEDSQPGDPKALGDFVGHLKGSKVFAEGPEEFQRKVRNE